MRSNNVPNRHNSFWRINRWRKALHARRKTCSHVLGRIPVPVSFKAFIFILVLFSLLCFVALFFKDSSNRLPQVQNDFIIRDTDILVWTKNTSELSTDDIYIKQIINHTVDPNQISAVDTSKRITEAPHLRSVILHVKLSDGKPALCRLVFNSHNISATNTTLYSSSLWDYPSLSGLAAALGLSNTLVPITLMRSIPLPLDSSLGARPVIRSIHHALRFRRSSMAFMYGSKTIYALAMIVPYGHHSSWLNKPAIQPHTWNPMAPSSIECRRHADSYCEQMQDTLLLTYLAGCVAIHASDAAFIGNKIHLLDPLNCWSDGPNIVMRDVWKAYVKSVSHFVTHIDRSTQRIHQHRAQLQHLVRVLNALASSKSRWGLSSRAREAVQFLERTN